MDDFVSVLVLIGVTYGMSIGFGMVVAQARGVRVAHRLWIRATLGTIAFVLRTIGDLLYWIAKLVRK